MTTAPLTEAERIARLERRVTVLTNILSVVLDALAAGVSLQLYSTIHDKLQDGTDLAGRFV